MKNSVKFAIVAAVLLVVAIAVNRGCASSKEVVMDVPSTPKNTEMMRMHEQMMNRAGPEAPQPAQP